MLTKAKMPGVKSTKARVVALFVALLLLVQVLPIGNFVALAATGSPIGAMNAVVQDSEFMSANPNTQAFLFTTVNGEKIRVVFYKDDLFRIWMANSGTGEFTVKDTADLPQAQLWDLGGITSEEDLEIVVKHDFGSMPSVTAADDGAYYDMKTPVLTLRVHKNPFRFEMLDVNGKSVWQEAQPLMRASSTTTQVLKTDAGEYFYGGGMQVGYFSHKGRQISISRSGWLPGQVASAVPFYMSTKGYGVFRNTYKTGTYDFRSNDVVETAHSEARFDAYYFYGPSFEDVLDGYTELTGRPSMIPRWGIGVGDASAYRQKIDTFEQGGNKPYTWQSNASNTPAMSPYGGFWHDEASVGVAKDLKEQYIDQGFPVSWALPNDGYGCEYNRENHPGGSLAKASAGLRAFGARLGLWVGEPYAYSSYNYTYGYPEEIHWVNGIIGGTRKTSGTQYTDAERNIMKPYFTQEITAQTVDWGVRVYKIDVAWSSQKGNKGDMGIFNQMLSNVQNKTGERGMVVTVYGWAGGQRYATLWSGDQTGDDTYTRYHIPTIIGTSMSGYPISTSDQGAIYSDNPGVYVRDMQMKTLIPTNIAMSNWSNGTTYAGANPENGVRATSDKRPGSPYHHTAEEIEINRKYAMLKQQLIPYLYTYARKAYEKGTPIVRPMVYNYQNDTFTYDAKTQYQYMSGDWFLAAPVLSPFDTVREDIYLPAGRWIDYWSGEEYFGPSIITVDAPYDTMPMFVRAGAIIPMYQESLYDGQETHNGKKVNDTLILDLYPEGETSFDLYEDDGYTMKYQDGAYAYTNITAKASQAGVTGPLTVTVGAADGDYEGKVAARKNLLMIHTATEPGSVKLGGQNGVELTRYNTKEAMEGAANGGWFFDADDKNGLLYVQTPSRSTGAETVVWVDAYMASESPEMENALPLAENVKAAGLSSDSIQVTWDAVPGATSYDLMIDGQTVKSNVTSGYTDSGLVPLSKHTYSVKARNANQESGWTRPVTGVVPEDATRFILDKSLMTATFNKSSISTGAVSSLTQYSTEYPANAIDEDIGSQWHSSDPGTDYYGNLNVALGGLYMIDKFEYMPRPEKSNGCITRYALYTSLDGTNYTQVATGTWSWTGESGQYTSRTISFAPTLARHVRLQAVASTGRFISGREIWVYRTEKDVALNSIAAGADATASSVWANDGSQLEKLTGLTATAADGTSESGGGYMPPLAVDGSTQDTGGWRTLKGKALPIALDLAFGSTQTVSAFTYYPLQGDYQREEHEGDVTGYALYARSVSGAYIWLAGGVWEADGEPKTVNFRPASAVGLQFVITNSVGNFAAAAEVEVYKQVSGTAGTGEVFPEPCYAAAAAVDGRDDTGWSSVNGQSATFTVDLGKSQTFDAINLLWGSQYGRNYTIEVSNDGESGWTTVQTVASNAASDCLYVFAPVAARYVRLVGTSASTAYTIREFKVFGTGALTDITLDASELSLIAGEEKTLTATASPITARDQTLVWESGNTNIFTVSRLGVVTGVNPGTATLTVKSSQAPDVFATCQVTVNVLTVDSLTLNKETLVLPVGGNFQLEARITPELAGGVPIAWRSDNASVTVSDDGFVTGLASGQATITASAQDKSDTVVVSVVDVTSFAVDNAAGTITVSFPALPDQVLKMLFAATYDDGTGAKSLGITYMSVDQGAKAVTLGYVPFSPNSQEKVDVAIQYKNGQRLSQTVSVAKGYAVAFDSQGADASARPSSVVVTGSATTVGTLPSEPIKAGYTFGGWFTQPNGQGTSFLADTAVDADITVYAYWKGLSRTVTFETNGGNDMEPVIVENGSRMPALANPVKADYQFMGWYKDTNLTTPWNLDTDVVLGDMTLYAKWTYICTVTFNANGGSDVAPVKVLQGQIAEEPVPVRDGYTFMGWYTDEAFTVHWNFADAVTKDMTLYAWWVRSGASVVTFDTNGGSDIASRNVANGMAVGVVTNPVRNGDVFMGWYQDEALTRPWNLLADLVYDSVTLYAKWKKPLFHYGFEQASELDVTGQPYAVVSKTSTAAVSEGTGLNGGGSLSLPSNNGYIRVDANSFAHTASEFTISMWINPATITRQQFLFTSSAGDDWFMIREGGYLGSYYMGTSDNPTFSHPPISANEWTYLTVTKTGTAVTYYINGKQVVSTGAGSWLGTATSFFALGGKSNSTTSTGCFTGLMDEVRFFNVALTADQVVDLYDYDRPADPLALTVEVNASAKKLVAGYSANIPVTVAVPEGVTGDVYAALYDPAGKLVAETLVVEGKATIKPTAAMLADTGANTVYTIRAYVDGQKSSSNAETIDVISMAGIDLWNPMVIADTNKTMISGVIFGHPITLMNGAVKLVSQEGERIIPEGDYNVVATSIMFKTPIPYGTKLIISGVRYPDLFPSYKFTFTITLT